MIECYQPNYYEASEQLGRDKNFFYLLKLREPETFEYIINLDKNPVKAVVMYQNQYNEIFSKILEWTFILEENRLMRRAGIMLCDLGIYSNPESFRSFIAKKSYSSDMIYNLKKFHRLKLILCALEGWTCPIDRS